MQDFEPRERGNSTAQFLRMPQEEDHRESTAVENDENTVPVLLTAKLFKGKFVPAPSQEFQKVAHVVPDLTALIKARLLGVPHVGGFPVFKKKSGLLRSSHVSLKPSGPLRKTGPVPSRSGKKMSAEAIKKRADYAERTNRLKLLECPAAMAGELSLMKTIVPSLADERSAAANLLALDHEDAQFFNAVCKILFRLWPKFYRRFLNDDRVAEMMFAIRMQENQSEILNMIKRWHQHPLH